MTYKEYKRSLRLSEILDKPLTNICYRIKSYCELIIENGVDMYYYITSDGSIVFDNKLVIRKLSNIFINGYEIKKLLKVEVVDKISEKDPVTYFSCVK